MLITASKYQRFFSTFHHFSSTKTGKHQSTDRNNSGCTIKYFGQYYHSINEGSQALLFMFAFSSHTRRYPAELVVNDQYDQLNCQ